MGTYSADSRDHDLGTPLQEKERALHALAVRAASVRKGLRDLTDQVVRGQNEVQVLLELFEERAEPDDEFARDLLSTEQTAQRLGQRLAHVEHGFQALEAAYLMRPDGLTEATALTALAQLLQSRSWRVVQALRRTRFLVFPPGSLRERLPRLGMRALRLWRREGFLAAFRKGSSRIVRKLARAVRDLRFWDSATRLETQPNLVLCSQQAGLPPALTSGPSETPRIHIDEFMQLDERSYYVEGWTWGDHLRGAQVTAVSTRGGRTPLDHLFKYARPDVCAFFGLPPQDHGDRKPAFVAFFQTGAPGLLHTSWLLECRGDSGAVARCPATPAARTLPQMRDSILADLQLPGDRALLLRHHVSPALQCLQQQIAKPQVGRIEQYGLPPAAPLSSLVIPLYRRIDFLEHQLAQLVRDPELCCADLIYVLDSPELADALHAHALQLSRLYRVPFRIVYLKNNVGYAGATNAGVEQARGRLLVLFNSDVLPDRPGWLGQMAAFYLKTPRLGALGPKLVYEDETLQHAGMYFLRQPGADVWENAHYYKGLHRYFPAAQKTRIVPAVTGACLMIKDDRYQEVGGLHNLFIQGDYEDSDLCLRLSQKGYDNWYLADCELYHLEGQSYPGPLRSLVYQVNSWQHTQLWGKYIEEIMARMTPRAA